jgi:glutathione S-transferase
LLDHAKLRRMVETPARLVVLRPSPWSERARWALDHHHVEYERIEHTPFLGERRLRRLIGSGRRRATVPALLLPDRALTESWDIAMFAERHGKGTPLIPAERLDEVRRYNELADRTMEAGRALVTRALLASPEAQLEALPPEVPRRVRRWLAPLTQLGTRWFAHKYSLDLSDAVAQIATVRSTLLGLRADLAKSSPYLLGTFSYADIVMALLLQAVDPVGDQYIRLGAASRRCWSQPALAAEFADLVAWRDLLYERHRHG